MSEAIQETEVTRVADASEESKLTFLSSMTFDKWIQLFTAVLLALTAWVTYNGYRISDNVMKRSALLQSEIAGNTSWEKFRDLQLNFRNSSAGKGYVYPSGDNRKDTDYQLLSERLLMAADVVSAIAEVDESWKDKQWAHTFAYEMRNHRDYFLSTDFLEGSDGLMSSYCTYRSPVRGWLRSSFETKQDKEAFRRLSDAEGACMAICKPEEGCT